MKRSFEHARHDDDERARHSVVSPGKRTRSEALPPRAADGPAAATADASTRAAGEARASHAEAGDDPMWFADGPPAGDAEAAAAGAGNMDPATMASLYYGINPPRHAEKAYQPGDGAPPLHPRPTTVGRSGTIVALATTIHNRPPFGRAAKFSICDRSGRVLYSGTLATPGRVDLPCFEPGSEVLVRPESLNTMVKLLTPEQIGRAEEEREEEDAQGVGPVDPATMASLYYGINPPRHAEKAYQPGDGAPPLHPRPTTVGRSGTIAALATTIYNRPPFGRKARFSILGRDGRVLFHGEVTTPGKVEVPGLPPGSQVLVRPETINTMVKLLTPEQIAGAADDDDGDQGAGRVSS